MKRGHRRFTAALGAVALGASALGIAASAFPLPAHATTNTTVFAGTGVDGYNGSDIAATTAKLWGPTGVAVSSTGDVYFAEMYNNIVRRVDSSETIRLVRGTPQTAKLIANGGLFHPSGVAVSATGTVFIADSLNHVVWSDSSVFAGNDSGAGGNAGDGGLAHSSGTKLSQVAGLAYDDSTSVLYIADQQNCTVRQVYNGYINRIAGTGTCGYSTGGGVATSAQLKNPASVAVARGKVYIADYGNNRIRVVDPQANTIADFAGTGSNSDTGDGGAATSAGISYPQGVAADPAGNIYVGTAGGRIRMINVMQHINTVASIGSTVLGMAFDRNAGSIYASAVNQKVYKVTGYWPPLPPSNSAVAIEAPSPHDPYLKRTIDISLSASGIDHYEYGWSTSSTTAPTGTLQTSSDTTNRKGTLDYSPTNPDQDWYLWIRSVQTGGPVNAWATPLRVHTPLAPIWVGVGDSYSSGHHQDSDEPYCVAADDPHFYPSSPPCVILGAPHLDANDSSFSWVTRAVSSINSAPNTPSQWQYTEDLLAISGRPTSSFGISSQTPGTDAWSAGATTQAAKLRWDLWARYDSWNLVSVTGGADDTSWVAQMRDWYSANWSGVIPPWDISTGVPSADCPSIDTVYNDLVNGKAASITSNVTGIVTMVSNYSPGARVAVVGYPYILDVGNDCAPDSGSWHGATSTIEELNSGLIAVTGANVKYVDLTATGNLGAQPVSNNYLQLTRLYGYPHANSTGQSKIAGAAVGVLRGSGW